MKTVITCHANADCDALASLVGALLLYPEAELVFPGSQERQVQEFYDDAVAPMLPCVSPRDLDPAGVGRLVVVDAHLASRVGHVKRILARPGVEIHVWDHHPLDEKDGADALDASFSRIERVGSASTLICEELRRRGTMTGCEFATCLLAGIHGDTGSFLYGSTTRRDMDAATWLMGLEPDLAVVSRLIRRVMGREQLKALSEMLENTEVREINGEAVAISSMHAEAFLDDFATLAPRIMEIEDCRVLFAVASMDDKVQVVGRSGTPRFDVGEVCRHLGGGGHCFAASASVKDMTVPQVRDFLLMQASFILNAGEDAGTLMTSPAVGVPSDSTMGDALSLMNRYGLKAVPVFAPGTRICDGLLSQETAARASGHGLDTVEASVYMQPSFRCVTSDACLQELVDIMIGGRQRLIPVVEGDPLGPAGEGLDEEEHYALLAQRNVVGVVTRTDLIRLFMGDRGARMPTVSKSRKERNLSQVMERNLPAPCLELLHLAGEIAHDMGISIYVAGGFVRDLVMEVRGRKWPDLDIDLVVEGDAAELAHQLAIRLKGRVKEHREFMTAMVLFPEDSLSSASRKAAPAHLAGRTMIKVDVASARLEFYNKPGALPQVERGSIKMDLFRRDFSINAMAVRLDPGSFGQLVDCFDGQNDIKSKRIRVLHALSFVEDPTRMFRAVRFEQRYGFKLGAQCEKFMRNAMDDLHLIESLAGSRITHELELMMLERDPYADFVRMGELGMLEAVHPLFALNDEKKEMADRVRKVLEWYSRMYLPEKPDMLAIMIIALCRRASGQELSGVFDRLQFSEKRAADAMAVRASIMAVRRGVRGWGDADGPMSALHALLCKAPLETVLYLLAIEDRPSQHEKLTRYIYRCRSMKADITGNDVIALGAKRGAAVGRILGAVVAAKMDDESLGREAQLALARRLVARENGEALP